MERSENRELESREELVVGPEGMFLAAVFGVLKDLVKEEWPIPKEFEGARREAIDEVLGTIRNRRRRLTLIYRFGLDGKGPRTPTQTANELGVLLRGSPYTERYARHIELEALRMLRDPSRSIYFYGLFMPLSEDRLGRVTLGINYGIELTRQTSLTKLTGLRLSDLGLSQKAIQELTDKLVIPPKYRFENDEWIPFSGNPENVRLLQALTNHCPDLTDATRTELIQGLAQVDSDN